MISSPACYICGSTTNDVRFCGLCRRWLCATCRADPVARARAAAADHVPALAPVADLAWRVVRALAAHATR